LETILSGATVADTLTDLQAQILGKNKAAVEQLLGKPLKKSAWTTSLPPQGADAAAVAAHEGSHLDEIWIYTSGRVHFAMDGKALKVDDKTSRDLPPDQPTTFV
jgi:hypothetical protein